MEKQGQHAYWKHYQVQGMVLCLVFRKVQEMVFQPEDLSIKALKVAEEPHEGYNAAEE
jgi:hypothetical protein